MLYQEKQPTACERFNPKNRFLLLFCNTYEVDKGWGCGWCGCRAFPFSLGVYIFAAVMIFNGVKDAIEIKKSNYLVEDRTQEATFVRFFYIKLIADCICILAGFLGVCSVCCFNYCLSVVSYYMAFLSFVLNSIFIVYSITKLADLKFWFNVGFLKVFTVIMWYVFEYIWLLYTWILFCNMVDINRKKQKEKEKANQYNFGF